MIKSTTHFILYTTAFYFCVVLMLNLLIAIIGERFGVVLEQTVPMDCVERTNLMMEIEGFAQLLRHFFSAQSTDEELFYIHYARYVSESEDDEGNVDVEGRMRVMQNKITKMKEFQHKEITGFSKHLQEMEQDVNASLNGIIKTIQHLQRKVDISWANEDQ